mmetsp:Transcript_36448/g.76822  ORF Transcript_36448/g.76822 Transcript_36448/m.76822 type:complete len:217 (-) Transcript_36448:487-1137(-)
MHLLMRIVRMLLRMLRIPILIRRIGRRYHDREERPGGHPLRHRHGHPVNVHRVPRSEDGGDADLDGGVSRRYHVRVLLLLLRMMMVVVRRRRRGIGMVRHHRIALVGGGVGIVRRIHGMMMMGMMVRRRRRRMRRTVVRRMTVMQRRMIRHWRMRRRMRMIVLGRMLGRRMMMRMLLLLLRLGHAIPSGMTPRIHELGDRIGVFGGRVLRLRRFRL